MTEIVIDSAGNSYTIDSSTLDPSRSYASQIPGSADYVAPTAPVNTTDRWITGSSGGYEWT